MNPRIDEEGNIPPTVEEAAAQWDARLRAPDCTDEDRRGFNAWRDADPAHLKAFERLQTIVATLRHERSRADVRALRDEALRVARSRQRRGWFGAAAASIAAVAIGALVWNLPVGELLRQPGFDPSTAASYSTGTGQSSTLALEDGSSVELNAQSGIEVRFSKSARHIELTKGQALFNVAKNERRPFIVTAGNRQIVAVGTQFDVRLDTRSVQVTLIEGKVRVVQDTAARESEPKQIELTPGKQLVATLPPAGGSASDDMTEPVTLVRDIDVTRVTDWRNGRIFLDNVLLADAVAEMNKHSAVEIRVADARLAGIRVNGMFKAGAQESFVAALEEYFPITARRQGDREIVLTATTAPPPDRD